MAERDVNGQRQAVEEPIGEQLSALVDGELGRDEQVFLLKRLAHDDPARRKLERYYLIRDALRRGLPEQRVEGLADRVRAELDEAPEHAAVSRDAAGAGWSGGWRRPALGGVFAAAVAVVAVTLWPDPLDPEAPRTASSEGGASPAAAEGPSLESFDRFLPEVLEGPAPVAMGEFSGSPERAPAGTGEEQGVAGGTQDRAATGEWEPVDPSDLGLQLREILVDHAEHVGTTGLGGILDYVRVAGYGEEE